MSRPLPPTAGTAPDTAAAKTDPLAETLADWLLAHGTAAAPSQALGARLAQGLRDAILQGVIVAGQRLPATRGLAQRLGVARNTLVAVYAQLEAEGFVVAGQGSGTYACRVAPERVSARLAQRRAPMESPTTSAPRLSTRGLRYQAHPLHRFWSRQPFCPGLFDAKLFPHALWNRLMAQPLRRADAALLGAGEPGGAPALREAIAQHVQVTRGVRCAPAQVIITDSTAQSLDLIARLLCDPGDSVWVENPCYWGASQTLADLGLALQPREVDDDGLPVPPPPPPSSRGAANKPRLAYLTPSHQFPTGAVMPLARRLEWLAYARQHGTLLIEDDYDSEYRYTGMPFPSLQGLDGGDRVLYLGSFSKTMYPGIRVGFMVVPAPLAEVFGEASADFYRDGDQLVQNALARFMADGHYAAHVRALRREYGARREALVQALWQAVPDLLADPAPALRILGGARGVHLALALPEHVDDQALASQCAAAGVTVIPLSVYCVGALRRGLVLSYAGCEAARIPALIAQMAPVVRRHLG